MRMRWIGGLALTAVIASGCAGGGGPRDGGEMCSGSSDCAPGEVCVDGACGPCRENADCATGETCFDGFCGECADNGDCAAGEACIAGSCRPCDDGSDCGAGQACVGGVCGPCTDNAGCPTGQACIESVCGLCRDNAECDPGQACIAGACGACAGTADCEAGEACVEGACGACTDNAQCLAGQACIADVCAPCTGNSDCDSGQACIGGACGPCSTSADCTAGEGCADGVCGACRSAADCAAGEGCSGDRCGPCAISDDCATGSVCDAMSCRAGIVPAMHQCPTVTFIGGGAWGYYACNGQMWSVPTCRTLEPPNATTSTCDYVGRLPLTTDGSAAPSGATRVPMYQCPEVNSIGGGSWGYYGCQGQITNLATCSTTEYPNTMSSTCTAVGDMTLYANEPAAPPGGRVVQMYQCPPSRSLGGGSWGYYGCQGQIWSAPSCTIIEYPSSVSDPCTPAGWVVLDP